MELQQFQQLCQQLAVKCVLIQLPAGVTRSQPMTASYHRGSLSQVWSEVHQLKTKIEQAGFPVIRVKLEAMVYNQDVPITDQDVIHHPKTQYFEFHVKSLLSSEMDLRALEQFCTQQGAHLSRNALKQSQGQQQRFITLRLFGVGRQTAQTRFEQLLDQLRTEGVILTQPQQEYIVYDSHQELDAGWINATGGSPNELD